MNTARRFLSAVLASSLACGAFVQSREAHAALIGTEQLAASMSAEQLRAPLLAALARDDVRRALAERGVSPEQARARIAALSDAEVLQLAACIDSAPAGAGDVIGYAVFIFVVLLATDILGFTKIFPFSRTVP